MMFLLGNRSLTFFDFFVIWTGILMTGSFLYHLSAFAVDHHAPSINHEGDEIKSLKIKATFERKEANLKIFRTLAHFRNHSLHHLFPSFDHSILAQLHEVFIETSIAFEVELRSYSFFECFVGEFQQLNRTKIIKCSTKSMFDQKSTIINECKISAKFLESHFCLLIHL
jgi:hypothetical protein